MTDFKRTSLSSSGAIRPTFTKAEARVFKIQERMRDNKQPIGKQHTDNQSEEDMSHRGGKGEKEEETGRRKKSKLIFFCFHRSRIYCP